MSKIISLFAIFAIVVLIGVAIEPVIARPGDNLQVFFR